MTGLVQLIDPVIEQADQRSISVECSGIARITPYNICSCA